ncbi:MAG: hypothetical protein LW875_08545 [Proteobacteria bacterium]|nr:hypothetical protein [Pseudomonadota bacterium]
MPVLAGVSLGPSFVEVALIEEKELKAFKRFYLPQTALSTGIKKFLEEAQLKPVKAQVSSRFLEKILGSKLGGTVAQVVTQGFETWPVLRQPTRPHYFELNPLRQDPLASQDLVFGVPERISSRGEILKPLDMQSLKPIHEKLQLMEVKKVVINFLHSQINPEHQNRAKAYFSELGYQVFSATRTESSSDEMPAWKENLLSACFAGSFEELREELKKGFDLPETDILFWMDQGRLAQPAPENYASTLHGWTHTVLQSRTEKSQSVLFLELENWFFVDAQGEQEYWESPWGRIKSQNPRFHRLRLQPSCEVIRHSSSGLGISREELSFEPGPMTFGRSVRPLLFDLLTEELGLEISTMTEAGRRKWQNTMIAFLKNSPDLSSLTLEKFSKKFMARILGQLADEVRSLHKKGSVFVSGFWAEPMLTHLQHEAPEIDWVLDSHSSTRAAVSASLCEGGIKS